MVDIVKEKAGRANRLSLLKELRPGVTLMEIGEACGVSAQSVSKWFAGGKMEDENVTKLAQFFKAEGATAAWIKYGEGDTPRKAGLQTGEGDGGLSTYASLPHYDIAASGGPGTEAQDYVEVRQQILFRRDWLIRKGWPESSLKIIDVDGDSMEPLISDGGIVLVNTEEKQVRDGRIYAYVDGSEIRIKQFFKRTGGGVVLHSINQQHQDEQIGPDKVESLNIIGRALWTAGNL